jgi:acetoin utilization protein AcuB
MITQKQAKPIRIENPVLGSKIKDYMTESPLTIGFDQTVARAEEMMAQRGIRHLPVLGAGEIVGVVSDRDIQFIKGVKGVDPRSTRLDEALTFDPYTVEPDTPLSEVCSVMAKHKYGSAIVAKEGKVVGVFTAIDAFRIIAEVFEEPKPRLESLEIKAQK